MTYTTIHLIRFIIVSALIAISFIFFTPHSFAYFTTAQEAIKLDGGGGLFMIDYSFGVKKHEVRLPVTAQYQGKASNNAVSYTIFDENDNVVEGTAQGFVFSNAMLQKDGMYFIPKGEARRLTLAVAFTPKVVDANKKYRLQVTYLPFTFNTTQQLQLNPSELVYYTTKLISL